MEIVTLMGKMRNNFPVKTKIVLKELRHITFNTFFYKYIDEIITSLSECSRSISDQHSSMLCHYRNNGRSLDLFRPAQNIFLYKYVDEIVIGSLSECPWSILADILSLTAHETVVTSLRRCFRPILANLNLCHAFNHLVPAHPGGPLITQSSRSIPTSTVIIHVNI